MARKKKVKKQDEIREYSDREIRLSNLRNNKIPHEYLTKLVMEYKARKKINPMVSMPSELAEVLLIIVDKMLGSPAWRGYTPDWKEEFRGRAIEHLVKYSHNFSPEKCKAGKANDAYNYFAMMTVRAFVQSLKKCKIYTENNIHINHDIIYNDNMWNENNEFKIDELRAHESDLNGFDGPNF